MTPRPPARRPLVPENIASLRPYEPGLSDEEIQQTYGLDRVIKLASNEGALGPSPRAIEALSDRLHRCHRYPAADRSPLRHALAQRYQVRADNVVLGSGSESIMACIVRAFLHDDDEVITTEGTFLGFPLLVRSRGVALTRLPLTSDLRFDLDAIADRIGSHTKIVYVANPNNPTGTYVTRSELERFVERVPGHVLVIWDEAYFEYAGSVPDYPDSMRYRLDNVITLRTFSKAYGLAGLRLGYGLAHRDLIEQIRKVRLPFEPSVLALAAGMGALNDREHLRRARELNRRERPKLVAALRGLGIDPIPSVANFLMLPCDDADHAAFLAQELLQRGIIIRGLRPFGFPAALRVTVGTERENRAFLAALADILETAAPPNPP